jgi:hypothetical protein
MRLISKQPAMIREISFGKYAGIPLEEIKK